VSSNETTVDSIEAGADVRSGERRRLAGAFKALSFSRISGLYVWAIVFAIFALWVPDTFLSGTTWQNIAASQALTALVTLGLLFPLAAGVYDLAIGQAVGLSAILSAYLATHGLDTGSALAVILLLGLAIGLLNSLLVVVIGINSFIATLGVSSVLLAMIGATSNRQQIIGLPEGMTELGTGEVFGVPLPVIYLVVFAAVAWYVLEHSPYGRYLYAIGGGPEAARLAGVPTKVLVAGALVISSVVAAFAGYIVTAKLGAGSPDVGAGYLLPAYAAAFLGATQIRPGRFNVLGTLLAVYLLATGVTGLQLAGAQFWVTDLFNGVVLILALALARLEGKLTRRRGAKPRRRADGVA
jgi:ribose transport system permease protein